MCKRVSRLAGLQLQQSDRAKDRGLLTEPRGVVEENREVGGNGGNGGSGETEKRRKGEREDVFILSSMTGKPSSSPHPIPTPSSRIPPRT